MSHHHKKIFFCCFLSLFCLSVCLLTTRPVFSSNTLAQSLEQKYKTHTSWQAAFEQETFIEILKEKIKKQGHITVKRPDKIRIEYGTEPRKIYTSDGKRLWVYQDKDLTAKQFDKPKKVISKEALSFLGGLQNLSELFDVIADLKEPDGFLKIKQKSLTKLHLIPKNPESQILKITLGLDANTFTIREAVIFNASGNVTHYTFQQIVFDQKLDDALFSLPKDPKRKIIKM